jgi:hypothetical protein
LFTRTETSGLHVYPYTGWKVYYLRANQNFFSTPGTRDRATRFEIDARHERGGLEAQDAGEASESGRSWAAETVLDVTDMSGAEFRGEGKLFLSELRV